MGACAAQEAMHADLTAWVAHSIYAHRLLNTTLAVAN